MTEWSNGWPAPAKLNLMLRIVGRLSNGYHELQTVFQFLDHADYLDFRLRNDGVIARVAPLLDVAPEDDLTLRAARRLAEHAGCACGVDIRLHKHLPMGGGLGGGSSDAATTLVALNALWGLEFEPQALASLALELGADVPVFVHGFAAWAEGVGEQLQPVTPDEAWYLVLIPDCHVSTAEVFQDPDLTRDSSRITIRAFVEGERVNDCLPVVRKRYPKVSQAFDWIGKFSEPRLTGTGACVFAAFDSRVAAESALTELPEDISGFVAQGLNGSPLLARLRQQQQTSTNK